jgi:hypothetical protein
LFVIVDAWPFDGHGSEEQMAAPTARREARVEQLTAEEAACRALSGARPSLDEILSLWPADRRNCIVLWVKVGHAGSLVIGAHPRDQPVAGAGRKVARDLRRIRDDVPVVLEFHDRGTVIVPLRTLRELQ